jgi:hypothetical protein
VSTVLDALRKLQREREAQLGPGHLRESVTDVIPLAAPRRRRLLPRLLGGVAVLFGAGALGYILWPLPLEVGEVDLAAVSAPGVRPSDASDRIPNALSVEIEESNLSRAPLGVDSVELEASGTESAEPVLLATPRFDVEAPPPAPPPPEPVSGRSPGTLAPRSSEVAEAKPAEVVPSAAAPSAERSASASRVAPARDRNDFPRVRVDRIRWHPVAARREAVLFVSDRPEIVAREGDIVAGLLVYRIDPDAVELRVGSESKLTRLGP